MNETSKLPNFFIVGAHKGGTTSLWQYMKSIPGVYFPKYIKEPHYFVRPEMNYFPRKITDFKSYQNLFKDVKDEKAIGEASATCLAHDETPELIHDMIPNAKIIMSLRNPISRTQSAFYGPRSDQIRRSFQSALKIALSDKQFEKPLSFFLLKNSLYSKAVKRYLEFFGKENVKILIFEEWVKEPKSTVEEILNFLGINYSDFGVESKAFNKFTHTRIPRSEFANLLLTNFKSIKMARSVLPLSMRRMLGEKILTKKTSSKPKISKTDNETLKNYFQDDVNDLKKLLERKLPWPEFLS